LIKSELRVGFTVSYSKHRLILRGVVVPTHRDLFIQMIQFHQQWHGAIGLRHCQIMTLYFILDNMDVVHQPKTHSHLSVASSTVATHWWEPSHNAQKP